MDCLATVAVPILLAAGAMAVAALVRSRDNAMAVAMLRAEVAHLRDLVRAVARTTAAAPAASPGEAAPPAAAAAAPPTAAQPDRAVQATPLPAPRIPAPPPAPDLGSPRRISFEELVGARLLVWVGAMALALAGAFLVKFSFDRGWISPPVRVALGVVFGVALLVLAEVLRRPAVRISAALAAAGIADLFACFLAAVHVYHLVPPAVGFLLMGLTTAVAVALSLRQGAIVALIGMAGGFLTPALIQTAQPSARNLFGYLLLLNAGLLAVAWRRRWRWLAGAALAASLLWVVVWLAAGPPGSDLAWLSLFLIAVAAGATLPPLTGAGARGPGASPASDAGAFGIGAPLAAIAAALALEAGTVARGGFALTEWGFLGLLAAGVLALAWLDPRYLALGWVAEAVAAALLAGWGSRLAVAEVDRFLAIVLAAGGFFAVVGWMAALAGPRHHPGVWAALSATAGVGFFLVGWAGGHGAAALGSEAWGGAALAAAALYLVAAVPVARRRRHHPELTPALAALAVAVSSLVSLSVPLALRRESFAAAWAIEAAALVWLAGRFGLPVLVTLARLLAAAAVLGAVFSGAAEQARGEPPLWNELLWAYGVPLLALAGAAWLARRPGPLAERPVLALTSPVRLASELEWEAVVVGFLLATLEIDQLFQRPALGIAAAGTTPGFPSGGLSEWAALACGWLACGWALLRTIRRPRRPHRPALASLELAGRLVILAGLGAAFAGPCVAANPLWQHRPVGATPLLNLLAVAYALPALLALAGGAEVRRRGGRRLPALAGGAALVLGFVWISLTVRQLFHGTYLDAGAGIGPPGSHLAAGAGANAAERYAYSAAWVLYGVALLVAGIARRGRLLRFGSLAVMLLAVGKTFLYDMARLSDLYRVLSFLGLGASLLLLGFLYQRFVFAGEPHLSGSPESHR